MKKYLQILFLSALFFGCDSEREPDSGSRSEQAGDPSSNTESANAGSMQRKGDLNPVTKVQDKEPIAIEDTNATTDSEFSNIVEFPVPAEPKVPAEVPANTNGDAAPKDETVKAPEVVFPEKVEPTDPVASSPPPTFPETVLVGNSGNAADTTGYGAVSYAYRIGKFEVTNTEYCAFLNAAAKKDPYRLYDSRMAGGYGGITRSGRSSDYSYEIKDDEGKKPVGYVTWESCARYANWLSNGGGDTDPQKGSYLLKGGIQPKVTLPDTQHWPQARRPNG